MEHINRHSLIVADSRGSNFAKHRLYNICHYQTHYIISRGAKIGDLKTRTLSGLKAISKNSIVLIFLCAGINEVTKRDFHPGGCELICAESNNLVENLVDFKRSVKQYHPKVVVTIGTIATVDLKAANKHYMDKGKLWSPKYSEEEIKIFQEKVDTSLREINHAIFEENKKPQEIHEIGYTVTHQLYLHQRVQRLFSKTKKDGRKIMKRRISPGSLVDGIHVSDPVCLNWIQTIHANSMKILKDISRLLTDQQQNK
jgi:hypothetical protein